MLSEHGVGEPGEAHPRVEPIGIGGRRAVLSSIEQCPGEMHNRERSLVLYFRRSGAAALLVGAVMLLAPGTTPTSAVDSSSGVVRAVAATWRLAGTYPSQGSCLAAGPVVAAGSQWQCNPSPRVPAAYDLYVMT
jgi:hypothetical protein